MNSTFRKTLTVSLGLALLAGCTVENGQYTSGAPRPDTAPAVAVAPADVQLIAGTPSFAYEEIEELSVSVNKLTAFHPAPTEEDAREALRKAAAELGANAVINVEITEPRVTPLSWGARKATGIAIRH